MMAGSLPAETPRGVRESDQLAGYASARLPESQKGNLLVSTPGGDQKVTTITEGANDMTTLLTIFYAVLTALLTVAAIVFTVAYGGEALIRYGRVDEHRVAGLQFWSLIGLVTAAIAAAVFFG